MQQRPAPPLKYLRLWPDLIKWEWQQRVKYNDIFRDEIFRDNKNEQEPFIPKVPFVDMHEAIVNSSNIFFIRLANEFNLEDQMAALYQSTGMRMNQRGGYDYARSTDTKKEMSDLCFLEKGCAEQRSKSI